MDIVQSDQLITVGVFLAVLVVAMLWVQANRSKLATRISNGRRMAVAEVTALGPDTKATLLDIDGRDYLIVCARKQAPVITALPAKPAEAPAAGPAPVAQLAEVRG